MDVDEVIAGLSDAERDALLDRLLEARREKSEADEGLGERVARLEALLAAGQSRRQRGPRGASTWPVDPGGYFWHEHRHCPHCGW